MIMCRDVQSLEQKLRSLKEGENVAQDARTEVIQLCNRYLQCL